MSKLAENEPRFYDFWLSHVNRADPQHERWVTDEGNQLDEAERRVSVYAEHFPLAGRDVLDVGSQWGATCVAFARAGARPAGIDIDDDFIEGARVRAAEQGVEVDFRKAVGEKLPFDDASFDFAVIHNVIEHVRSHRETLDEMIRVLRPGGGLWIQAPNRLSPQLLRRDPHYNMLGLSVMPGWAGGFYVTKIRRHPSWTVGTLPVGPRIERMLTDRGMKIVASSRTTAAEADGLEGRLSRISSTGLFYLRPYFFIAATKAGG